MKLFLTVATIGVILGTLLQSRQSEASCRDLSVDVCEHGENKPFESDNSLNNEFKCQEFCAFYDNPDFHKCEFFTFNRQDNFCSLFEYDVKDYIDSCLKKGMTQTPLFDECLDFNEPCAQFVEGNCRLAEIDENYRVENMEICQKMAVFKDAAYWVYNNEPIQDPSVEGEANCLIYLDSEKKTCDTVVGLPTPFYDHEDCAESITSTTTKSTTMKAPETTTTPTPEKTTTRIETTPATTSTTSTTLKPEKTTTSIHTKPATTSTTPKPEKTTTRIQTTPATTSTSTTPKPEKTTTRIQTTPATTSTTPKPEKTTTRIQTTTATTSTTSTTPKPEKTTTRIQTTKATTSITPKPETTTKNCPEGWISSPNGCFLFAINVEPKTWYEAVEYCEELGGYLAEVLNDETQRFLVAQAIGTSTNWWLGATDQKTEGTWIWTRTGELVDMDSPAWGPGLPDQYYPYNEDCLHLMVDLGYRWNDIRCGFKGGAWYFPYPMKPLCQKRF